MSDVPIVKGDKLREAMRVVWFANKFEKGISTSELSRMSGYSSTGIWSAIEHGWFKEAPEDKMIQLTDKGELYLKEKLLTSFELLRMVFALITSFLMFLALQDIFLDVFNIPLKYEWEHLFPSIVFLAVVYYFYYRIVWIVRKRKK